MLLAGQFGERGVQLFYIASAFSMFLALERRPIGSAIDLRDFWIRRFARLAPMFWLAFMVYLPIYGDTPSFWAPEGPALLDKVLTVLMLHTWWPTAANSIVPGGWSVGVEMTFYAVLPVLVMLVRNLWAALLLLAAAFAASYPATQLLELLYAGTTTPVLINQFATVLSFPAQAPAFTCGIVLYFLHRAGARLHWSAATVLLFVGLAFMALIKNDTGYWFVVQGKAVLFTNLTLFGLGLLGFAAAVVLCPSLPLNNRVARYVGEVSYSLYLIHILWISYVLKSTKWLGLNLAGDVGFVTFTIITVITGTAAATVTYRLVEKPAIAWAKRLSDRSRRPVEFDAVSQST
ncbi:hypothetical protein BHK69_07905 [Bosea vaviloviae]|uniref:Acyltransferase 3 domain-containing protein n=2 Tax=Bosea vaviloviae TaxID=1526658 RepID=A0A1D7TZ55_9HYPH|nr:hypothetical protein BHK69_07905 [Bosea vaviloviae]